MTTKQSPHWGWDDFLKTYHKQRHSEAETREDIYSPRNYQPSWQTGMRARTVRVNGMTNVEVELRPEPQPKDVYEHRRNNFIWIYLWSTAWDTCNLSCYCCNRMDTYRGRNNIAISSQLLFDSNNVRANRDRLTDIHEGIYIGAAVVILSASRSRFLVTHPENS